MNYKVTVVTIFYFLLAGLAACAPLPATSLPATEQLLPSTTPVPIATSTSIPTPTNSPVPTPTARPLVPDFKHIIMIVFENHEFDSVVGNQTMPVYNQFIKENTL